VPSLAWLATTDFQRYFDRAMFLGALLLLWPVVRALRIGSVRDLGLRPDPRPGWHVALGFLVAAGLLWVLGLCLWETGIYTLRAQGLTPGTLAGFAVTAAAVALAEEAFFRGALQGLIARTARPGTAAVTAAVIFALLHFLKPPEHATGHGSIDWFAGFAFLPKCFWQWGDPRLVFGGFATLLCVGLVLGWARLRTGALWLPIGLHGGWIFGLKTFSRVTRHTTPPGWLAGDDLLHGIGPVVVVLLTGAVVWAATRKEPGAPILPAGD
jgi:membrane protease YdiL (CAAX protease family)